MSAILKGMRVDSERTNKRFGYLAFFADGDIRRHTTNFPKSHCVRVITAPWERWQYHPILPGEEVIDGRQLHRFRGGAHVYEWFRTEAEAVRVARLALSKTNDQWFREVGGEVHPLNKKYAGQPEYSAVEVVPVKVVWAAAETLETLKELGDPRLLIGNGTPVLEAYL